MSRFSSLDGVHAASRDLERQRLERKIGQLRREVETTDGSADPRGDRRFKPPGRRPQVAPRRPAEPRGHSAGHRAPRPPSQPEAEGDAAPSLEMAWLLARQQRMDKDACEVEAFLLRHDLGRYTSVIANEPEGQWGSLNDLRAADGAALSAAGLPAADARRLLAALAEEDAAETATPAVGSAPLRPSRPGSSSSGVRQALPPSLTDVEAGAPGEQRWGRIGRAPPGWQLRGGTAGERRAGGPIALQPTKVDTACGDSDGPDEPDDLGEEADGVPNSRPPLPEPHAVDSAVASRPSSSSGAPVLHSPAANRPATGAAWPATAASRPGTASSAAGVEKACCYQCYKQVYRHHVLSFEGRDFCSDACVEAFQKVLAGRAERERELGQLRAAASRCGTPSGLAE